VPILLELRRIILNEIDEDQIVILAEADGDRALPIVIGLFEANSIDRRVRGQPSPRPLTHDLIVESIELMGGDIQDILITELREHTYYAQMRIRHDGDLIPIDCRPSDAIAVAVTARVPIYVHEDVFGELPDE